MPLLEKEVVSGIEAGSGPAFSHPPERRDLIRSD